MLNDVQRTSSRNVEMKVRELMFLFRPCLRGNWEEIWITMALVHPVIFPLSLTVLQSHVPDCTLLSSTVLQSHVPDCTEIYCIQLYCNLIYPTAIYTVYCILLYSTAVQSHVPDWTLLSSTVLQSHVPDCTLLYCTVLKSTVFNCTAISCTWLHSTVLKSTVFNCTAISCIPDCTLLILQLTVPNCTTNLYLMYLTVFYYTAIHYSTVLRTFSASTDNILFVLWLIELLY